MATDDRSQDAPLDPVLAEAIGGLRDRGPDRDLWTDIAPQLERRRPKGTLLVRWPTALAAGLALVAGSAAVTSWLGRNATDSGETPIASAALAGGQDSAQGPALVAAAFGDADLALEGAIRDLTTTIEAALPQLDPATRGELSRSMDALQQAVTDATNRARTAPGDLRAAQYLTSTLRRQHDVLRTIAVAASRS